MKLSKLKSLLMAHADRFFRIRLPDGGGVPVSFHVTEVGRVQKAFLDCGGTLRETTTCQIQIWVGEDYDHRIETGKMASILGKAFLDLVSSAGLRPKPLSTPVAIITFPAKAMWTPSLVR